MKPSTPMKAMRLKCLDCCCGSPQEVRLCTVENCALYLYRFGHRPKNAPLDLEDTETDTELPEDEDDDSNASVARGKPGRN